MIKYRDAEPGMVLLVDDNPWCVVIATYEAQVGGQAWVRLRVMHPTGDLEDRLLPPDGEASCIGTVTLPEHVVNRCAF